MKSGFAGAVLLLACIPTLLLLSSIQNNSHSARIHGTLEIRAIQNNGFERAEAEIFIDKKIEHALLQASLAHMDAGKIKAQTNRAIMESFQELGIPKASICKGTEIMGELNEESLGKISKTIVLRAANATVVQYSISGHPQTSSYPCARIGNATHGMVFAIPQGYITSTVVPA